MGWLSSQLSALSFQPSHVQDSENGHKKGLPPRIGAPDHCEQLSG